MHQGEKKNSSQYATEQKHNSSDITAVIVNTLRLQTISLKHPEAFSVPWQICWFGQGSQQ
jgi:hypothetical protein